MNIDLGHGRRTAALALTLALGWLALASADPAPFCHRLLSPPVDSAVELELDMSPSVMALLTTDHGKVGDLFDGVNAPKWVEQQGLEAKDWDPLDYDTKLSLLQASAEARHQDFFRDRKIHGLHVRGDAHLKFDTKTKFLGKTYEPGESDVDVSKVLGLVEYRGPNEVKTASGVELHFRGRQSSGLMSNDAWTFLQAAHIPRDHQHVHMVAPLPTEKLAANPTLQAARMADFFRRANLLAEMNDIVRGAKIIDNRTATVIYFASMTPDMLGGVARYFYDVGHGDNHPIGDTYKMGWVGMRGSDKYDQPGLWGLEYRAIGSRDNPAKVRDVLDSLQWDMNNDDYGIAPDTFQQWLEGRMGANPTADPSRTIESTWYNESWETLISHAGPAVKKALGWNGLLRRFRAAQTRLLYGKGAEVKMLIYDWTADPLLAGDPERAAQIGDAQAEALKQVLKGGSGHEVVVKFLRESGLYEQVARSVGLPVTSL